MEGSFYFNIIALCQLVFLLVVTILAINIIYNKIQNSPKTHYGVSIISFALAYLIAGDAIREIASSIDDNFYYISQDYSNILNDKVTINSSPKYIRIFTYIIHLVPFFLTWILLNSLINIIATDIETKRDKNEIETNFNNYIIPIFDHPTVRSILTITIFLFSLYLVLASVVSVPEFQIINKEQDKRDEYISKFKLELDPVGFKPAKFINISIDSLRKIKKNSLDSTGESRGRLISMYEIINNRISSIQRNINDRKEQALNNYSVAISNNISSGALENYKSNLAQSIHIFANFDNRVDYDIEILNAALDDYKNNKLISDYLSLGGAEIPIAYPFLPEPPVRSGELGFIGFSFQWLLNTRSPSIALIVGLIGFGLLGAIGSRFIRDRINYSIPYKTLFSNDIVAIIITGISAAIVVFLAVKGSIAVFTNNPNSNDVNPYAIFFLCFVASIFSEQAWLWARERFTQTISDQNSSETDDEKLHNQTNTSYKEVKTDEEKTELANNKDTDKKQTISQTKEIKESPTEENKTELDKDEDYEDGIPQM